jgi:hypothetical protein
LIALFGRELDLHLSGGHLLTRIIEYGSFKDESTPRAEVTVGPHCFG